MLGAIEGHGYSAGAHDVSDLSALGARHAPVMLALNGLTGAVTILFALGALRPALHIPGRTAIAAWLVALSLPSLDTFTDTFFRLDCQAAKAACTDSAAMSSWHARLHVAFFLIALVATLVAPFALARRMAALDRWRDLTGPTRRYGLVLVVALVLTMATIGSSIQGWTQRVAILVACGGMMALAAATRRRYANG